MKVELGPLKFCNLGRCRTYEPRAEPFCCERDRSRAELSGKWMPPKANSPSAICVLICRDTQALCRADPDLSGPMDTDPPKPKASLWQAGARDSHGLKSALDQGRTRLSVCRMT